MFLEVHIQKRPEHVATSPVASSDELRGDLCCTCVEVIAHFLSGFKEQTNSTAEEFIASIHL